MNAPRDILGAIAVRKARGDIAHAMTIAAKHNQNGTGCAAILAAQVGAAA